MTLGKKVYAWSLKLSYMQMQGMDTYHGSHGDSSGFESWAGLSRFCCCRRMEFQTKTLFSAIPSWWRALFWSLSPLIPQILCEEFIVLCSCSYALWSPCRFLDVPRARQGYQLWVSMASPTLSRIYFGWMFWLGNIVRPSVGRRTSLSAHWYWVGFLRHQHQCVH